MNPRYFEARLKRFQSVFKSCERFDPSLETALDVFWICGCAVPCSHLERYRNHHDQVGQNIVANVEAGFGDEAGRHQLSDAEHLYRQFQQMFNDYDVLITPGNQYCRRCRAAERDGSQRRTDEELYECFGFDVFVDAYG